jgi:hypothetical protein
MGFHTREAIENNIAAANKSPGEFLFERPSRSRSADTDAANRPGWSPMAAMSAGVAVQVNGLGSTLCSAR